MMAATTASACRNNSVTPANAIIAIPTARQSRLAMALCSSLAVRSRRSSSSVVTLT